MKISLTIQNNTHQDHLEGRFPELKFIVDGEAREATPAELMKHGFHVRPADVDRVADAVSARINADGHEAMLRNLQLKAQR